MQTLSSHQDSHRAYKLEEQLFLIDIDLHAWGAVVKDKEVSKKVASEYNSNEKLGTFTKHLGARSALAEIRALDSQIRSYINSNTVPWIEKGPRAGKNDKFMDIAEYVREAKDKRLALVKKFIASYPDLVDNDRQEHTSLGKLWKEEDYPSVAEVARRFKFEVHVQFLQDLDDIRTSLHSDLVQQIRDEEKQKRNEQFEKAIKSVFARVLDVVQNLKEAMDKTGQKNGRFHDTIVTNITDLLDCIPALNITNDPKLTAIAAEVRKELTLFDGDVLKQDFGARQQVSTKAEEILKKLNSYI